MRFSCLLLFCLLLSCERHERVGQAISAEDTSAWCAAPSCATCGLNSVFIESSCPEMEAWCSAPGPCPVPLDPLFCAYQAPSDSCIDVGLSVCGGGASTHCCSPNGGALGPAWYCKEPGDCPASSACLIPVCSPLQQPGPTGAPGKCSFAVAPDGIGCNDGGTHCEMGVCVP